jgi:hypothetical protein
VPAWPPPITITSNVFEYRIKTTNQYFRAAYCTENQTAQR